MSSFQPRIALVTGVLDLGGSTTFLLNLGGELRHREIPFSIYSFHNHHPLKSDFDYFSVPVAMENKKSRIFEDRLGSILHQIRAFKPTHVVGCLGSDSFEVLRYMPVGVQRWGMIQSDDPGVYDTLGRFTPWLDKVVCVSSKIEQNCCIDRMLRSVQKLYIPYGVPMPNATLRNCTTSLPEKIRILYLGRLEHEQKRVRLFPLIYKKLIDQGINFSWTIAGAGQESDFLRNKMPSGAGHEIYFTGAVDYRDIPILFSKHDVYLLASDYEGLPLSLLEAMGHGLVPVVSNLPSGIPEVVNSGCGVLVNPSDTDGYAAGIAFLAQNPDQLSKFSVAAKKQVFQNFSVTAMTQRWINALSLSDFKLPDWIKIDHINRPVCAKSSLLYLPEFRPFRRFLKLFRRVKIEFLGLGFYHNKG